MFTKFYPPVRCTIVGHSWIPDNWPGEVIGIDHACVSNVGTCVRFDEPVPGASMLMIWMLSPDVIVTTGE